MTVAPSRMWPSLGGRSLVYVVAGLAALLWPGITLPAVVLSFGLFALLDGLITLYGSLRAGTGGRPWGARFLEGLVSAAVGVLVLALPGLSPAALFYLIAGWAIVTGVFEIGASFRLREQLRGEWMLAVGGVLSVLLGVAVLVQPEGNPVAIVSFLGAYGILFGGLGLLLARRLRRRSMSPGGTTQQSDATGAETTREADSERVAPVAAKRERPSVLRVLLSGVKLLLLVALVLVLLQPFVQRSRVDEERSALLDQFQSERESRVIAMIHRTETMNVLGVPVSRSIGIQDSEQILRAIRLTESGRPIDLILHTPGGLVLASEQVARALRRHEGRVTVFVPHYAMSGGTLMALAADSIVMDPNAVLGPVDPQIGGMPAASILRVTQVKPPEAMTDQMIVMADVAEKARRQVRDFVAELLSDRMSEEEADRLAVTMTRGQWTHDYAITLDRARELGLSVSTEMPEIVYRLMDLYPQSGQGRPSVMYGPLRPAGGAGQGGPTGDAEPIESTGRGIVPR